MEREYLTVWRSFRRALGQRNAALRDQATDAVLKAWETELASAGEIVSGLRRAYVGRLAPAFSEVGRQLLDAEVSLTYLPGWDQTLSLAEALEAARGSDRMAGFTRVGPQRADLRFEIDAERSRWRASKGQQKLLGAALILAQAQLIAGEGDSRVALVIDEPGADLDDDRLAAFLTAVSAVPAQVFLACITARGLPLASGGKMFHVERGSAKALL